VVHKLFNHHGSGSTFEVGHEKTQTDILQTLQLLLTQPGIAVALQHVDNNADTPMSRLISGSPSGNQSIAIEIVALLRQKFPNSLRQKGLVKKCIERSRFSLFVALLESGAFMDANDIQKASEYIDKNRHRSEVLRAEKTLAMLIQSSVVEVKKCLLTLESANSRDEAKLFGLDGGRCLALSFATANNIIHVGLKEPEVYHIAGQADAIRIRTKLSKNALAAWVMQSGFEQAVFGAENFYTGYFVLQFHQIQHVLAISPQVRGIPLAKATDEQLANIDLDSFTRLYLMTLIFDPENDDINKYCLIEQVSDVVTYQIVRTEPFSAIGLRVEKTLPHLVSVIFTHPILMSLSLDANVLLRFVSSEPV
ncbi:MAG: hypothetical protein KDH94_08715, partial [Coxiellaceae bacterium]|nr:hypothetical protein [Coxiellaceae bacterium]